MQVRQYLKTSGDYVIKNKVCAKRMIRFICFRALMIVLNNSRPTVAIHITDPISHLTDHQSAVRLYYYGFNSLSLAIDRKRTVNLRNQRVGHHQVSDYSIILSR